MLNRAWPENWDQIGLWEYYVTKYHSVANRALREANILSTQCHFPPFWEDFLLSIGQKIHAISNTFLGEGIWHPKLMLTLLTMVRFSKFEIGLLKKLQTTRLWEHNFRAQPSVALIIWSVYIWSTKL